MTEKNGTNGKTPQKRTYSEAEKLGAIVIAVRDGAAAAMAATKVPSSTLYQWMEAAGGIGEIRTLASVRADHALSEAEVVVSEMVGKRAERISDAELMLTFRKMIDARTTAAGPNAEANAAAQTNVSTTVVNITD